MERRLHRFNVSLRDEWRHGYERAFDTYSKTSVPRAQPGMAVFIVSDQWQREIVRRVTSRFFYPVQVWCIADESVDGATDVGLSLDTVHLPVYTRDIGGWPWVRRVHWSPWGPNFPSPITYQVLAAIAQWPGMNLSLICQMLGKKPKSQSVKSAAGLLHRSGFLNRTSEKNYYCYWITGRSIFVLCRLDGVARRHIDGRVQRQWDTQVVPVHDQEATQTLAQFAYSGVPVANGWRVWEGWGDGALAPDGMVFLSLSPYGAGWHYFEEERSARRRRRAEEKLHNYLSRWRPNLWPVIFVLWDDEAEQIFQAIGREHGLKLLTTTRQRLARYGALGPCWSMYGETVTLG